MTEEWRSVSVLILKKRKVDVQSNKYRSIKLMSHTMKLYERVVEPRIRNKVDICKQQWLHIIFALRKVKEKCNGNGEVQD